MGNAMQAAGADHIFPLVCEVKRQFFLPEESLSILVTISEKDRLPMTIPMTLKLSSRLVEHTARRSSKNSVVVVAIRTAVVVRFSSWISSRRACEQNCTGSMLLWWEPCWCCFLRWRSHKSRFSGLERCHSLVGMELFWIHQPCRATYYYSWALWGTIEILNFNRMVHTFISLRNSVVFYVTASPTVLYYKRGASPMMTCERERMELHIGRHRIASSVPTDWGRTAPLHACLWWSLQIHTKYKHLKCSLLLLAPPPPACLGTSSSAMNWLASEVVVKRERESERYRCVQ